MYDNGDGTYEAYFSYFNSTSAELEAAIGVTDEGSVKNFFSPGEPSRGQPSVFKRGAFRGAFHFTFSGEPLVWTLKVKNGREFQIHVSAKSPRLTQVEPVVECINKNSAGGFVATFGYVNSNEIEISLPIGKRNRFFPGKEDRAQPNQFFSGRVTGAFLVGFDTELLWILSGKPAAVSPEANVCDCTASDSTTTQVTLLKTSESLVSLIVGTLRRFSDASLARVSNAPPGVKKKIKERFDRAKRKVLAELATAHKLTRSVPVLSRNCPRLPPGCSVVDDGPLLEQLKSFYVTKQRQLKRLVQRTSFLDPATAKKNKAAIAKAKVIVKQALTDLGKVPRFRTVCK